MILVDTSAWIEFLRDTGSPACGEVERLLDADVVTCAPVLMEVLAGARDDAHLRNLRRLLDRAITVPTDEVRYEEAAALYRTCRLRGETVRRMIDCLIAAIAIGADVAVLHADEDFDVLARHTTLAVHPLRS